MGMKTIFGSCFGVAILFMSANVSHAQQLILDNFSSQNAKNVFLSAPPSGVLAQSFTTGASAFNFLNVFVVANAQNPGKLQLAIYDDIGGNPGNNLSGFQGGIRQDNTSKFFNLSSAVSANTKYWAILGNIDPGNASFSWTDSNNDTNTGDGTIGIGSDAMKVSFGNNGLWTPVANFFPPGQFLDTESFTLHVEGSNTITAILPEPGTLPLVLLVGGSLVPVVRRRKK